MPFGMNTKRVIEVIVKGTDTSGPLWSNLGGKVKGLLKNKAALATAAAAVGTAVVAMVRNMARAYDQAIAKAGQFQQAVLEVNTLVGGNRSEVRRLSQDLQALAVQYGQLDDVMARAEYNTVSAGFTDTAEALHILDVASRAAIGGITDVNTAVRVITQTLNAYGQGADQAEQVAGHLFATIKGGVTTFEELAGQIGKVTAVAAPANISFDQIASAMAVLTQRGLNTAEAATALSALILAIGAASGESKDLLDELGITLDNGLGPALVAISEASGGAIDKLAEMIPNVRAIRAAAVAAGDGGEGFADQLDAMANGVSDFNRAYQIMSEGYQAAADRNTAAQNRFNTAIGATAIEGKTAALNGMADGANAMAEAIEDNSDSVALLNWQLGRLWGGVSHAAGEVGAFGVEVANATLATAMFGAGGTTTAKILRDIDRAAAEAAASVSDLNLELSDPWAADGGPGTRDPFLDLVRPDQAAIQQAAEETLENFAAAMGVATSTPVLDPKTMTWVDVPRAAEEIAEDITAAYMEAQERLKADPPNLARSTEAAADDFADALGDELLLYEDIIERENELARIRAYDAAIAAGDQEALNALIQGEIDLHDAQQEALREIIEIEQERADRLAEQQDAQRDVEQITAQMIGSFQQLATNSLAAFMSGRDGAIMFGRALREQVIRAISAAIVKLVIMRGLMKLVGMGSGGDSPDFIGPPAPVNVAAFGGSYMPRAAVGFAVPDGPRGLDSVPVLTMPGEHIFRRSLSQRLDSFLAAQDAATMVSPFAVGENGRGGVSVEMRVARPVGYLDMLDLGDAAAVAAEKVAEANL